MPVIIPLLLIWVFFACRTLEVAETSYEKLNISHKVAIDSAVIELIEPYKSSLEANMEVEVAYLKEDLVKEQPESNLGNHIAWITHWTAERELKKDIDFAIMNYGGIRVPYVSSGPLRVRDAYQIMPFDNYIVVLELNGADVRQLLDQIAGYGGWPVHNLTFRISGNTAVDIRVNGNALEADRIYTMAISDYLANGGDDLDILKHFDQTNTNILIRDAIINAWKQAALIGEQVLAVKDGRVTVE